MSEAPESDVPEVGDKTTDRIYLGQDAAIEQASQAHKDRWLEIFLQMMESDRFKQFVNTNFDIHSFVDNDEKVVHTRVIERPMEVVLDHIMKQAGQDGPPPPELTSVPKEDEAPKAEKPRAEGQALAPAQLIKLHHALQAAGVKKPTQLVQRVLSILGHTRPKKGESNFILPASAGDVK